MFSGNTAVKRKPGPLKCWSGTGSFYQIFLASTAGKLFCYFEKVRPKALAHIFDMRHIIILASFLHSFLLYYMLRLIVYLFLCTLHAVFICCFCSPSFIPPFTLVHSSPPPVSDSGITSINSSFTNRIMWAMQWMEPAVLLILYGLCSGHGIWRCRSGCPGAHAVGGERGRD